MVMCQTTQRLPVPTSNKYLKVDGMAKSRWRNSGDIRKGFDSFLNEAGTEVAAGNPTGNGTLTPADRARQLGLQSNGKGGYIDPNTGQVVAQTVNGELVFYSQNRATGGAVSDSAGGAAIVSDTPSWADPTTGMVVTPPSKAETPEEQGSVPDPVPAQAPHGYNSFMIQQKQQAYETQKMMDQAQSVPGDMSMGGETEGDIGGMIAQENFTPKDLLKKSADAVQPPQDQARISCTEIIKNTQRF